MLRLTDKFPDFSHFLRSAGKLTDNNFEAQPRSIYILPNKYGLMFSVLIIAMLIGSINYANNLGFLLTFFLAAIGVVSIIHTWLNLLGLHFQILPASTVFAGETAQLPFSISNQSDKYRGAIELHFSDSNSSKLIDIANFSEQQEQLPLKTHQRGLLSIPKITVETRFPLGLFRAWMYLKTEEKMLVYPSPLTVDLPVSLHHSNDSNISHDLNGRDDFYSHRNYQSSDSPRHIDWKVLARGKGLQTKVFSDVLSEKIWLSLSLFQAPSLEQQISLLTGAIIQAEEEGLIYGLQLDNLELAPSRGPAHYHQCLKALALYGLPA